jgi:hypothetical protein
MTILCSIDDFDTNVFNKSMHERVNDLSELGDEAVD